MSDIKRFTAFGGTYEDADGPVVLFRDHEARVRELEADNAKLEHRIAIMREGILEARREGCACDFHLYGEDQELTTPEALDAYCTLEQRNTELECRSVECLSANAKMREALDEMAEAYGEMEKGIDDPILCHYNGVRLHNAMEGLRTIVNPDYQPNYEPAQARAVGGEVK